MTQEAVLIGPNGLPNCPPDTVIGAGEQGTTVCLPFPHALWIPSPVMLLWLGFILVVFAIVSVKLLQWPSLPKCGERPNG